MFGDRVAEVGLKIARSKTAKTVDEAVQAAEEINFPVMVRIAYALGGLGSGIVNNKEELIEKARRAFSFTNQILIEESFTDGKKLNTKLFEIITITALQSVRWKILTRWEFTLATAL